MNGRTGLYVQGLSHPKYANVSAVVTAKASLANASRALLLQNWLERHRVCENYGSADGLGGGTGQRSNAFYTWGALLGYVSLMEGGLLAEA